MVHDDAAKVDALGDDDVGVGRLLHCVDVLVLQHHQQRVKLLRGDFAIVALCHRVEGGVIIVLQQTLNTPKLAAELILIKVQYLCVFDAGGGSLSRFHIPQFEFGGFSSQSLWFGFIVALVQINRGWTDGRLLRHLVRIVRIVQWCLWRFGCGQGRRWRRRHCGGGHWLLVERRGRSR